MARHQLQRRQFIPLSMEEAWAFFSTPRNLEALTPDFLHFRILSEVPEDLHNGLIIAYQIAAVAGIPMTWITEIKHVIPGRQFVDEQRVGPFRFWFHEHRFEPVEGGIEMVDTVHYVMPWGLLGEIVHNVFIQDRLQKIFDFRQHFIERQWSHEGPSQPPSCS